MTTVPRQIVRTLREGYEFAPAYSTDELLRGVCHITPLLIEEEKVAFQAIGSAAGVSSRRKKAAVRYKELSPTVKTMLLKGESLKRTATLMKISTTLVYLIIDSSEELRTIWNQRKK